MRAGALLALVLMLWASGARADPAYLADLQQRAAEAHLADSRDWQVLLHYRRNTLGHGVTSDADDPRFFLAPGGKTDPAAELAATLVAFFSNEAVGAEPQPAQCAFAARYAWLRQALGFDTRLPEQRCEAFSRWKSELDAGAATLVFTSAYLNNPASLFGHTLLRLDRRDASAGTPLLAYAVSYAADDSGSTGLMYGIKGIAGGFTGYFELQSYDRLVRNYSDIENRDIWEYRLNLGAGQMERLIAHLWELRGVRFDYFFFSENCAWQLLTLLEVADPALALSDRFALWVAPPDVLRLINGEAGLVQGATPRPARGSAIRRRYAALDAPERVQAQAIRADLEQVGRPAFRALAPDRQALLLDLAMDLRQRGGGAMPGKEGEGAVAPPVDEGLHRLLAARSALGPGVPSFAIAPYAGRPEAGHASRRGGLALGQRAGQGFIELSVRASFHDLLEADAGYAPEAAIELLGASLRHTPGTGRTRLNALNLIAIESLPPFNPLLPRPAWRAEAGWAPAPRRDCPDCLVFRAQAQAGLATETRWPWRVLWFALPGLVFEDGAGRPERAGPGFNAGLIAEPGAGWKVSAHLTRTAYRWGTHADETRWTLAQHYTLQRDLAVRAEWKQLGDLREFSVGLQIYF